MGVHTGEPRRRTPANSLDRDHQMLRDAALKLIRRLNIKGVAMAQFAAEHPQVSTGS